MTIKIDKYTLIPQSNGQYQIHWRDSQQQYVTLFDLLHLVEHTCQSHLQAIQECRDYFVFAFTNESRFLSLPFSQSFLEILPTSAPSHLSGSNAGIYYLQQFCLVYNSIFSTTVSLSDLQPLCQDVISRFQ